MKKTRTPPAWSANLMANSGNTIYGVSVIEVSKSWARESCMTHIIWITSITVVSCQLDQPLSIETNRIYASLNWVIIDSGNGLSPVRCQAIPEPMLFYCQLDSWEQVSVKFKSELIISIEENAIENVICQNGSHFVRGGGGGGGMR